MSEPRGLRGTTNEGSNLMQRIIRRVLDLLGRCPDCHHRYGFNGDCDECIEVRYGG